PRKKPPKSSNLILRAQASRSFALSAFHGGRGVCRMQRSFAMTIGKRLYAGFGLILGTLLILGIVNLIAVNRQGSALNSVRTIEGIRYKIMQNRLALNNFLLSGDPRDEEKVTRGMTDTADALKLGQAQAGSDSLRDRLAQVENTEVSWGDNFAKPLLA